MNDAKTCVNKQDMSVGKLMPVVMRYAWKTVLVKEVNNDFFHLEMNPVLRVCRNTVVCHTL